MGALRDDPDHSNNLASESTLIRFSPSAEQLQQDLLDALGDSRFLGSGRAGSSAIEKGLRSL